MPTAPAFKATKPPRSSESTAGMSASDWTMQFLADMLDAPVDRPAAIETTALGAAFLAGSQAGLYPGPRSSRRPGVGNAVLRHRCRLRSVNRDIVAGAKRSGASFRRLCPSAKI
jgi:sugar (pentulose or hexulose) kinase